MEKWKNKSMKLSKREGYLNINKMQPNMKNGN